MVAFLCAELHCLPSQLRNEDYNDIENLIAYYQARAEKQRRLAKK